MTTGTSPLTTSRRTDTMKIAIDVILILFMIGAMVYLHLKKKKK